MIRRGIGVQSFVSAGIVPNDADAQAFIDAAGITDATQQSAINTLVTDLKGYSIWDKMKAIYPFVGGTSSTHKWNLRDPRDLDSAYRLVFSGGITHSSTGVLFGGVNGYANTKLIPNTSLSSLNISISTYIRTNVTENKQDLGCQDDNVAAGSTAYLATRTSSNNFVASIQSLDANRAIISNTDSRGLFCGSRTTSTSLKSYKNGILQTTQTTSTSIALPQIEIVLGALNYRSGPAPNVINYSSKELAFAHIGDGLLDSEAANLYTVVQAYQTTLSRNV